jgi:hypothetical protein
MYIINNMKAACTLLLLGSVVLAKRIDLDDDLGVGEQIDIGSLTNEKLQAAN